MQSYNQGKYLLAGRLCTIFEAKVVVERCTGLNVLLASELPFNRHVFSCVEDNGDSSSQLDLQTRSTGAGRGFEVVLGGAVFRLEFSECDQDPSCLYTLPISFFWKMTVFLLTLSLPPPHPPFSFPRPLD